MSDRKKGIDRRSVIKTLGTAAATAALGTAGATRVLGEPRPQEEGRPQAPQAKEGAKPAGIAGGRYMADLFNAYGVTAVFHIPQAIGRCLAAIEIAGYPIKRVLTHGEKACAYMADGYARISGRPGICAAQAVGAANLAAGLRDAYMACSPVIAITGMALPGEKYRAQYQVGPDDYPAYRQYTKANYQVDIVDRLPDLLRQAFRDATSGTPGPVSLLLSSNGQQAIDTANTALPFIVEKQYARVPSHRCPPEMDAVKDAVQRLRQAQRPAIMVDAGAKWSGAGPEALKLAEALNCPIANSYPAYSLVPNNHPLYVGVPGRYSRGCANRALARADLVLFVGSRAGGMETDNWTAVSQGAQVIQIGVEALDLGRNLPNAVSLLGDGKLILQALLAELGSGARKDAAWAAEAQGFVKEYVDQATANRNSDAVPIRPERLMKELSDALPDNAAVFVDTANSATFALQNLWINSRNWDFIPCYGSLGWAFPAAIGGKVAAPDRPIVCHCGDGGFWYHLQEVETAVRHGINTVTIVRNNNALGSEEGWARGAYEGKPGPKFGELWQYSKLDLAKVAECFGAVGIHVEKPSEIRPALDKAFAAGKPVVIDVQVDPTGPMQSWHNQRRG